MHDFVKVLDFGLVKTMAASDEANLTNPNSVTGTPYYLSPEGVNQPDRVDTRSDVYALGAVGYFLLTGTPVFNGATVIEICLKHSKELPDPPSVRKRQPVSAELEELLLRCLAKSADDRPADATALLRELEMIHVTGTWTNADAQSWWASHGGIDNPSASATVLVSNTVSMGED